MTAIAFVLISAGLVILAISTLGVITLPDFYARAHAVAKSETLGILLTLGGLIVYYGWQDGTSALLLVLVVALIANPTAVHALARAAATRAPDEETAQRRPPEPK